jgi:Zn-dependent protease
MTLVLVQIIILVFSVIIHEVAHGYAAYGLGDTTAKYAGRLTLSPFAHIDLFGSIIVPVLLYVTHSPLMLGWAKPVPINPDNFSTKRFGEAWVAFAGPLSNIVIALLFGLILRFSLFHLGDKTIILFGYIVLINLVLALFNLIPVPPLDGSKIIFSLFPKTFQTVRFALEGVGFILLLLFVFFLWRYLSPVVGYLFTLITGISY